MKNYTLGDIVNMSNAKVKELINKVDTEALAHALKEADDEVRNKIIPNMTKAAKKQFDKMEEDLKKIKKSDIKKFTSKIESELKNLLKK
ncbi:MAG: FliG C-terminal domain-containing protein [Bacteroidales bacterium]